MAHVDSKIVAVDGACRRNGRHNARAAVGVYFGRGNDLNEARALDEWDGPPSNQRAELIAAVEALEIVEEEIRSPWTDLEIVTLVVKTDSAYVYNGITDWIFDWMDAGFYATSGWRVKNRDLFVELNDLVYRLDSRGVNVLFWKVDRADNANADRLANLALDRAEEEEENYY